MKATTEVLTPYGGEQQIHGLICLGTALSSSVCVCVSVCIYINMYIIWLSYSKEKKPPYFLHNHCKLDHLIGWLYSTSKFWENPFCLNCLQLALW